MASLALAERLDQLGAEHLGQQLPPRLAVPVLARQRATVGQHQVGGPVHEPAFPGRPSTLPIRGKSLVKTRTRSATVGTAWHPLAYVVLPLFFCLLGFSERDRNAPGASSGWRPSEAFWTPALHPRAVHGAGGLDTLNMITTTDRLTCRTLPLVAQ